jgi:mediator of RNA polymerase II transcription subunit 12
MPDSVSTFLNDSGETLRLLCRVILPLRDDPSKLPSLESNIKDDFISAVQTSLESVLLTWKQPDHSVEPRRLEVVTLIARLNQFALGFPEFWTKGMSEKGEALIVVYFQMMKVGASILVIAFTYKIGSRSATHFWATWACSRFSSIPLVLY